jgi:hypothetical protein
MSVKTLVKTRERLPKSVIPQGEGRNHKKFWQIAGQTSSSHSPYKLLSQNTCFEIRKHVFSNIPCQNKWRTWSCTCCARLLNTQLVVKNDRSSPAGRCNKYRHELAQGTEERGCGFNVATSTTATFPTVSVCCPRPIIRRWGK